MSTHENNVTTTLLAFFAGAAVGAAAVLLLTPEPGRELRGKLAREARFRMAPKTAGEDYKYDGGDAWI